jgi:hypothetical protein
MADADRKYVRVYYNDLIRDYPDVWADNDQLATWLRLLATADPMWPTPPELPRSVKPRVLGRLVDSSLVVTTADHRYRMKGLDAERDMRAQSARNAAAKRWHSEGIQTSDAGAMPKRERIRAETSKAENEPNARDGLPSLTAEAVRALEERTGHTWSQAGERQLSEYDRLIGDHGLEAVCGAMDAVANGKRMTARQLIWPAMKLLEPFVIPDAEDAAAKEREAVRVRRTNQGVWARRIERYRYTGEWDPEWGDPPSKETRVPA